MDILKSGGSKVSALEVERAILEVNDVVAEVAVLGVEDSTWGQVIGAVVRLKDVPLSQLVAMNSRIAQQAAVKASLVRSEGSTALDDADVEVAEVALQVLSTHCYEALSKEKQPRLFRFVKEIPKNTMGKVNKKALASQAFPLKQ